MKPCPFCDCNQLEIISDLDENYVMCTACMATGPTAPGVVHAEVLWNNQILENYFDENETLKDEIDILKTTIKELKEDIIDLQEQIEDND